MVVRRRIGRCQGRYVHTGFLSQKFEVLIYSSRLARRVTLALSRVTLAISKVMQVTSKAIRVLSKGTLISKVIQAISSATETNKMMLAMSKATTSSRVIRHTVLRKEVKNTG